MGPEDPEVPNLAQDINLKIRRKAEGDIASF